MKQELWRNILLVGGGAVIAQAITFLFSTFITRIYSPEVFGLVGVIGSFISILMPLAGLCLPVAIVLPKENKDAQVIGMVSMILSVLVCFVVLFVIFAYDFSGVSKDFNALYYLIAIGLFFSALLNVYKNWLLRLFLFKVKSITTVTHSLVFNSSKVVIGALNPGAWSLAVVTILGPLIQVLLIKFYTKDTIPIFTRNLLTIENIKSVLSKYSEFPKYRMPQLFLETLSSGLPVIVLSMLYGAEAAGYLIIASLALGAPVTVLAQAVQSVFFPSFNEEYKNNSNYFLSLLKILFVMSAFSFIPFAVVFFYGEELFVIVFGDGWAKSGEYAGWLAIYSFFLLLTRPIISAMMVLSGQKKLLFFEVFTGALKLIALFLPAIYVGDALSSIKAYSVVSSFMSIILIGYSLNYTFKKYRGFNEIVNI